MRADKVVNPSLAPKDPLTGQDYPVGTLININSDICHIPSPASLNKGIGHPCCCNENEEYCPHGEACCTKYAPHSEPARGCEAVELVRRELPNESGPFLYDPVNKVPVPNQAATEAHWLSQLNTLQAAKAQLEATKAALIAASKSTAAIDAQIASKQAEITTALTYLP